MPWKPPARLQRNPLSAKSGTLGMNRNCGARDLYFCDDPPEFPQGRIGKGDSRQPSGLSTGGNRARLPPRTKPYALSILLIEACYPAGFFSFGNSRSWQTRQLSRPLEYGKEHGPGKFPRVGILQRRMIAGKDDETAWEGVLDAVREDETGTRW